MAALSDGLAAAEQTSASPAAVSDLYSSLTEKRFAQIAEALDAAGLGPADYIYAPLKWRLQRPDVSRLNLRRALWRASKDAVARPLPVPGTLPHAAILAASSYAISANLLRQVIAAFEPGEAFLFYPGDLPLRQLPAGPMDHVRSLSALVPALIFAIRVRSLLNAAHTEIETVERDRIVLAAFIHRIYRWAATSIIDKVRPKCLVIGNGNRPLEFSLWAEARARGIATVLLPYAEITLKPTRFLSLCRGVFDLVLPFSESSSAQMRRLNPEVPTEVVGFPAGFDSVEKDGEAAERGCSKGDTWNVLYFAGNNFEAAAAKLLREAFDGSTNLRLRVRLHPRSAGPEGREAFAWLAPECISDPKRVSLAEDIKNACVATAVRSTAAIDAMIAGVPFVWLSPVEAREQLKFSTLRKQNLTPLEAKTSNELRELLQGLYDDEGGRQRIVEEQRSRLRAAGYDRNYFNLVVAALRKLVDVVAA